MAGPFPDLIDYERALQILQVSDDHLLDLISAGHLSTRMVGADIYFPREEFEAYVEARGEAGLHLPSAPARPDTSGRRRGVSQAKLAARSAARAAKTSDDLNSLIDFDEAARVLGISGDDLFELVSGGRLTVQRQGADLYLPREDVEAYKAGRLSPARAAPPAPPASRDSDRRPTAPVVRPPATEPPIRNAEPPTSDSIVAAAPTPPAGRTRSKTSMTMSFSQAAMEKVPKRKKKPDPLVPYDQTLKELEIDDDKLLDLIASGRLNPIKRGKDRVFRRSQIEQAKDDLAADGLGPKARAHTPEEMVERLARQGKPAEALKLHQSIKPSLIEATTHSIRGAELVVKCASLAKAQVKAGQYEKALELMEKAIELRPNTPVLPITRAQCLIKLGRMAEAMEAIDDIEQRFSRHRAAIRDLLQEAVQESRQREYTTTSEAERRVLEVAEQEFRDRLDALRAEKEGLEAEKEGLAAQMGKLERQLEDAQKVLDEERSRTVEDNQFTVSADGMENLEQRFMRLVAEAIKANGVNDSLADELRGMVSHLLDGERERTAEQARAAQNQAILLLEKKVKRLATSLQEAHLDRDHARRESARFAAGGRGIASVADAGLDDSDPEFAKKLELLKIIFEENRAMREHIEGLGVKLAFRKRTPGSEAPEEQAQEDERLADSETPDEAEPQLAEAAASGDGDDLYGELINPDDLPWEPGTSVGTEVRGVNEGAEDPGAPVKKVSALTSVEAPPIEIRRGGGGGE